MDRATTVFKELFLILEIPKTKNKNLSHKLQTNPQKKNTNLIFLTVNTVKPFIISSVYVTVCENSSVKLFHDSFMLCISGSDELIISYIEFFPKSFIRLRNEITMVSRVASISSC